MIKLSRRKRGFSLVETVLTTVVVAIVIAGVSSYLRLTQNISKQTNANADVVGIESYVRNLVFTQMGVIMKNAADGCGCKRTTTAIDLTKLCRPLDDALSKVWDEVYQVAKVDTTGNSSGVKTLAFLPFRSELPLSASDRAKVPKSVSDAVTRCTSSQTIPAPGSTSAGGGGAGAGPAIFGFLRRQPIVPVLPSLGSGIHFCVRVVPTDYSLEDSFVKSNLIFVEASISYASAVPGAAAPNCSNFTSTVPKELRRFVMYYSIYSRKIEPETALATQVVLTKDATDNFNVIDGSVSGRVEPAGAL